MSTVHIYAFFTLSPVERDVNIAKIWKSTILENSLIIKVFWTVANMSYSDSDFCSSSKKLKLSNDNGNPVFPIYNLPEELVLMITSYLVRIIVSQLIKNYLIILVEQLSLYESIFQDVRDLINFSHCSGHVFRIFNSNDSLWRRILFSEGDLNKFCKNEWFSDAIKSLKFQSSYKPNLRFFTLYNGRISWFVFINVHFILKTRQLFIQLYNCECSKLIYMMLKNIWRNWSKGKFRNVASLPHSSLPGQALYSTNQFFIWWSRFSKIYYCYFKARWVLKYLYQCFSVVTRYWLEILLLH